MELALRSSDPTVEIIPNHQFKISYAALAGVAQWIECRKQRNRNTGLRSTDNGWGLTVGVGRIE